MSNLGKKPTDDDEVEQLLRAAHDDALLKLSVNSHMARASASAAIDPEIDSRFQALKKPQKPTKIPDSVKTAPIKKDTGDSKVDGAAAEGDLFARFAALKNSLPSYNTKGSKTDFASDESVNQHVGEEGDDEDEVEKVIKWAMDAARLDPSPPSDDDDDDDYDSDDDESDNDDDDDREVDRGKKGKRKGVDRGKKGKRK